MNSTVTQSTVGNMTHGHCMRHDTNCEASRWLHVAETRSLLPPLDKVVFRPH